MDMIKTSEFINNYTDKLEELSESQLNILKQIMLESIDIDYNVEDRFDYILEFVSNISDEEAKLFDFVNGETVMESILDEIKRTNDVKTVAKKAKEKILDIKITEEVKETEVPLLSIVSEAMTDLLGIKGFEEIPVGMFFDIINECKNAEIKTNTIEDVVSSIKEYIKENLLDLNKDDYLGETVKEFLNDYKNLDDLLNELNSVNETILENIEDEIHREIFEKGSKCTDLIKIKESIDSKEIVENLKAKKTIKFMESIKENLSNLSEEKEMQIIFIPGLIDKILQ